MNCTVRVVVVPAAAGKETRRKVPRVKTSALIVGLMGPVFWKGRLMLTVSPGLTVAAPGMGLNEMVPDELAGTFGVQSCRHGGLRRPRFPSRRY